MTSVRRPIRSRLSSDDYPDAAGRIPGERDCFPLCQETSDRRMHVQAWINRECRTRSDGYHLTRRKKHIHAKPDEWVVVHRRRRPARSPRRSHGGSVPPWVIVVGALVVIWAVIWIFNEIIDFIGQHWIPIVIVVGAGVAVWAMWFRVPSKVDSPTDVRHPPGHEDQGSDEEWHQTNP